MEYVSLYHKRGFFYLWSLWYCSYIQHKDQRCFFIIATSRQPLCFWFTAQRKAKLVAIGTMSKALCRNSVSGKKFPYLRVLSFYTTQVLHSSAIRPVEYFTYNVLDVPTLSHFWKKIEKKSLPTCLQVNVSSCIQLCFSITVIKYA